jgi:hypothetical protein
MEINYQLLELPRPGLNSIHLGPPQEEEQIGPYSGDCEIPPTRADLALLRRSSNEGGQPNATPEKPNRGAC